MIPVHVAAVKSIRNAVESNPVISLSCYILVDVYTIVIYNRDAVRLPDYYKKAMFDASVIIFFSFQKNIPISGFKNCTDGDDYG